MIFLNIILLFIIFAFSISHRLSPLHVAVRHNQLECVKYLISAGAFINSCDRFGFRPIHDAALYGYIECLEELLSNDASADGPSAPGQEHLTPLYYAIQQNHKECISLLKKHSSVPENLLWEMASKRGNISIIDLHEDNSKAMRGGMISTIICIK